MKVDFLVADITRLPLKDEACQLAINVACLNLIVNQRVRDSHLLEVKRILVHQGIFFSCNLASTASTSVKQFYRKMGNKPGDTLPRKIAVHGQEKEVSLPIIAAWPKSEQQYVREFKKAGFEIIRVYGEETEPAGGDCWIIVAQEQ